MGAVNFTGLASGIDSNAIIQSVLDQQRTARIKPLQSKVETIQATNDSFSKLKELLGNLSDASQAFRDVNGTVLSKNAASSSDSKLTASATNAASNGSYSVNVLSLAKNASYSFNDRFSSTSQAIGASINNADPAANRTVSVQTGTGVDQETVSIQLTNSTTVSDFVSQFNATSTKSEASLVNVGTTSAPSYAIVINSSNQGSAKGTVAVSVGSSVSGAGSFASSTLSQATDAQFTVSGISGTFTRGTNTINDVITGVNLSLNSTGSATVTVSDNPDQTTNSVQTFVDSYNAIVSYINDNDQVTTDQNTQTAVFGSLSGTSLDENILSSLRGGLTSSSIKGGLVNTLSDLGVSTQRDGSLKFDANAFKSALLNDPESVRTVTKNLGEGLGSVDGTIAQYTRYNGLIDTSVTSNQNQISDANNQVGRIEDSLTKQETELKAQYARLESLVGKLNSSQSALSSIIGSIR